MKQEHELPPNPITPMLASLIDKSGGYGMADTIWQLMHEFANQAIEADRQRRGDAIGEIKLWCLHIQGPDDVHPAPGREYAQVAADLHNARFDKVSERTGVMCKAVVAPWPYCAESHARGVGSFVEDWIAPQPAEPSRGEQRIKWLREVRECAEHVATSDYFGIDAAINKLMSVVERWPQPAEPVRVPSLDDVERDATGETWMGMRVAAWEWIVSSPLGELPHHATHWSTGPKDAERLYRESDIRTLLARYGNQENKNG